jgi:hypothetical protein
MTAEQRDMMGRHAMMHQRHRVSGHRHYAEYPAAGHHPRYRHRVRYWSWSPDDALTLELNRQELARVASEPVVQYGSSAPPAPMAAPSAGYEEPPPGFPQPFPRF